jgi:membrane associated rhomboid family serine protease
MFQLTHFKDLSQVLKSILLINMGVFILALIAQVSGSLILSSFLVQLFLIPEAFAEVWRFLTYAFLHTHPLHFLFNMLILWMFGDEVSRIMGDKKFVGYYLGAAIFSGLFAVPFYLSGLLGVNVHILGASGALFSVLYAYARYFPERIILIFFVFPMRIKYAIYIFAGLDLLMINSGDQIAHLVHLGGFVAGILYFQFTKPGRNLLRRSRSKTSQPSEIFVKKINLNEDTFFELDEKLEILLQKISKSGIESLSDSEKAYLQKKSEEKRRRRENIIDLRDYKD